MTVNYAKYEYKHAYLSQDFGRDLALRKLNLTESELEEMVGRYKRGKRKGQLKGSIEWIRCTHGGWVKTGRYDFDAGIAQGFVLPKGSFNYRIVVTEWESSFRGPYPVNKLIKQITCEYSYFNNMN